MRRHIEILRFAINLSSSFDAIYSRIGTGDNLRIGYTFGFNQLLQFDARNFLRGGTKVQRSADHGCSEQHQDDSDAGELGIFEILHGYFEIEGEKVAKVGWLESEAGAEIELLPLTRLSAGKRPALFIRRAI